MSGLSLKDKIAVFNERQKKQFSINKKSNRILKERTTFFDHLIVQNLEDVVTFHDAQNNFFIAAVGGYGRQELYPKSDIDMVIVHKNFDEASLNNIYHSIIIPLIDAKVDVGYSFRSLRDLSFNVQQDLQTITSLLDMRFLYGDYSMFHSFENAIFGNYMKKHRKEYLKYKLIEYRKRLEKYNDSPYILEPNIKEGIGGLREFHYISWLTKALLGVKDIESLIYIGYIDKKEVDNLNRAFDFLSVVRIYTHFFHYLQKEKLSFDIQEELSEFLGYQDSSRALNVEHFMSDYYRYTHEVFLIATKIIHNLNLAFKQNNTYQRKEIDFGIYLEGFGDGEINGMPKVVKNNPRLLLKSFYYAKKYKRRLSYKMQNLVKETAASLKNVVWDDEFRNLFFQIISPDDDFTNEILREMYITRFLEVLFPEFGNIYHKMQFDAYHIYTVDMHSILSVSKVVELFSKNEEQIKDRVKKPYLLVLAALLHDIGKGEGSDHSVKGAVFVENIAKRMNLDFKDRELLVFLVKNHLLLSHIAQRRDISDYKFLKKVYKDIIKTRENLYYLYFLTMVDLMSVGEGVWSTWKNRLLNNLIKNFEKILISEKDFTDKEVHVKKNELKRLLIKIGKNQLIPLIEILTDNYLLNNETKEIIKYLEIDYALLSTEKDYILNITPYEKERYFEVVIATKDEKGLFSQLSGAFTLAGFNILSANINTRKNGNVLDIFMVDLGKRDYEFDKTMFQNLDGYLQQIIGHKEKIDKKVLEKAKKYHKKSIFKEKNEVFFDNVSSEKYTIIEVFAQDHMGLLFEITKTLAHLNLDIHFSRISTLGDRAVDVFYVFRNGSKIEDEKELEELRNSLIKCISYSR